MNPSSPDSLAVNPPSLLITDDEAPARRELQRLLSSLEPRLSIHQAENGEQALQQVRQQLGDIVFLDIDMPGLSGLQVAEQLLQMPAPPLVIFATAWSEHAVRGFELQALDYLLKPYRRARVREALDRALQTLQQREQRQTREQALGRFLNQQQPSIQRLWAEDAVGNRRLLAYADIHTVEARDKQVFAQTDAGELRIRTTLGELEQSLPAEQFMRVHRSWIVNLNRVQEVIPWDSHSLTLVLQGPAKREIPVGRTYADGLRQLVGW